MWSLASFQRGEGEEEEVEVEVAALLLNRSMVSYSLRTPAEERSGAPAASAAPAGGLERYRGACSPATIAARERLSFAFEERENTSLIFLLRRSIRFFPPFCSSLTFSLCSFFAAMGRDGSSSKKDKRKKNKKEKIKSRRSSPSSSSSSDDSDGGGRGEAEARRLARASKLVRRTRVEVEEEKKDVDGGGGGHLFLTSD
mgnify:CR=1 FL=1